MKLADLREISRLARDHYDLSRAMRQCEICYSQPWTCTANGHEIEVMATDIDAVFTEMRTKIESKLQALGVTDFAQQNKPEPHSAHHMRESAGQ